MRSARRWASASGRCARWTAWTWSCRQAACSDCWARTARASPCRDCDTSLPRGGVVLPQLADRIVPYQSRWPIDVGSVVYTDHAHYTLFLLDAQDDSVLAAPRPAEAFQLIVQGLGHSPGILAQRPVDELENRPSGVERDSPRRPRLESSEHSGREPDGVCVAHASASSWRWRSSSAARRSSSV